MDKAVINVTSQLRNYVYCLKAADKFNETLTIAAVRAVSHFMQKSVLGNFQDFIINNPRLKYNFRELMLQHYRTDIFKLETAKRKYLEPELLPFD